LRLAIFGGTFDPIHNAHLVIAREAVRACGLEKVLFVPASTPPHKSGVTHAGYEHRYRMVELACRGEPMFEPSRLEEGERQSYSIYTIEKVLSSLASGDRLFFLIGADAFAEIQTWRRWQDVLQSVEFVIASRPGHSYTIPPGVVAHRLETLALDVSSSDIRGKLAAGRDDVAVPPAVLDYIRKHGLYR
jgi:nicotinate-nucleotide adenylyltransferase